MKKVLLLSLFIPILCFGQYTDIPDQNFEQALIDLGHDDVFDGKVLTASISTIDSLDVDFKNINNLKGIEDFSNLIYLRCLYNNLSSLDISNNHALKHLVCSDNFLTNLDLTQNLALELLACGSNQLTNLDLTQNLYLTHLACHNNQLISLNLFGSSNLTYLFCATNQLTDLNLSGCFALNQLVCAENLLESLDVSMCTSLRSLTCVDNQLNCLNLKNGLTDSVNNHMYHVEAVLNPNLNCIEIDDPKWLTYPGLYFDQGVTFSVNCNYPNNCLSNTTDISDEDKIIKIFPNPTDNLIQIEIENYIGSFEAELYDFTGKLLETTNKTSLSLVNYPSGIYLLKVAYGDRVEQMKVVKE